MLAQIVCGWKGCSQRAASHSAWVSKAPMICQSHTPGWGRGWRRTQRITGYRINLFPTRGPPTLQDAAQGVPTSPTTTRSARDPRSPQVRSTAPLGSHTSRAGCKEVVHRSAILPARGGPTTAWDPFYHPFPGGPTRRSDTRPRATSPCHPEGPLCQDAVPPWPCATLAWHGVCMCATLAWPPAPKGLQEACRPPATCPLYGNPNRQWGIYARAQCN